MICLGAAELLSITGYKRAKEQQRFFAALGIPATIRPDNTLSVCREHYLNLRTVAVSAHNAPKQVKNIRGSK